MRRARLLALFLDVLVCAVPADLAGLALTGVVWRFLPGPRGAIPGIWAAAGGGGGRGLPAPGRAAAGRARRWLALEARRPGRARRRGRWGSIRRNFPLHRAVLEPLRRLAVLSDGTAPRRTDRRTGIRILRIT